MGAFDTAITPVAVTPANTSDTDLDPGHTLDAHVSLSIALVPAETSSVVVRWGVKPNGGSNHWKATDVTLNPGEAIDGMVYTLQPGDVIVVQTSRANDAVFSVTGVESSA